jgi:hypothetical protein
MSDIKQIYDANVDIIIQYPDSSSPTKFFFDSHKAHKAHKGLFFDSHKAHKAHKVRRLKPAGLLPDNQNTSFMYFINLAEQSEEPFVSFVSFVG